MEKKGEPFDTIERFALASPTRNAGTEAGS
jgi:hypothetical protein